MGSVKNLYVVFSDIMMKMRWFNPFRKVKVLLVIFQIMFLIFQIAINPNAIVNAVSPEVGLEIKHIIQIRDGGLVVINTIIDLRNDDVTPISNLKIGFSTDFDQNLDDVVAYGSQERELEVIRDGISGSISWFDVMFETAVEQGISSSLSIYFVFSNLVSYNDSDSNIYTVLFPESPVLTLDAERCDVEVYLPNGVTALQSSLSGLLNETKTPLISYSNLVGNISFMGNIHILECNHLDSEAILDTWGNLYFYDTYRIRNIGKNSLQDLTLHLLPNAEEISVYDIGGQLGFVDKNLDEYREVIINLRYILREYEACSFIVKYKVNTNPYLSLTDSWSKWRLIIKSFTSLNLTIKNRKVIITLPEGAKYQNSSPKGVISTSGLLQTPLIQYVFQNISPIRSLSLIVDYEYLIFWSALRLTLWMGGIITIIVSLVLYKKRRRQPLQIIQDKNIESIRAFIEKYDERMMIWSEIEALEKRLDDKTISRKRYNRRKRITRQRFRSLDRAFSNAKNKIKQLDPRYAEHISKIEKIETELLALRDNIDGLRAQYRSGRLSKRTYRDLKSGYEKRIKRVERGLESTIIEFKRSI